MSKLINFDVLDKFCREELEFDNDATLVELEDGLKEVVRDYLTDVGIIQHPSDVEKLDL
jgi:hypothetical protein